jgi:hypothetical protein
MKGDSNIVQEMMSVQGATRFTVVADGKTIGQYQGRIPKDEYAMAYLRAFGFCQEFVYINNHGEKEEISYNFTDIESYLMDKNEFVEIISNMKIKELSVLASHTINLKNFTFAKIDAGVVADLDESDDVEKAFSNLWEIAAVQVRDKREEILSTMFGKG